MSAASHGATSGVVLGLVIVLLAQQFGVLDLSALLPAVEDLLLGAILGGVVGGLVGWALGRRYLASPRAA